MPSSSNASRIDFAVDAYVSEKLEPGDIALVAEAGFRAFEPYRGPTMRYVERPNELNERGFTGWITLVLAVPRASEDESTAMDRLLTNKRYLMETLGIRAL